MKKQLVFALITALMMVSSGSKAQDTRYYDLVLDSLEIPALNKDTTIDVWVELDLWMDDTRRIFYKSIVQLTNKGATILVGQKMYDVPRTQSISCKVLIGPASRYEISQYYNPYFSYASSIFATSKGRQHLFLDLKTARGEEIFVEKATALKISWHLEASKL